jgi:hypothetical protein
VLATAGDVRTEKGLVCGVAGYPTSDCGGAVKEVSPAAKAADQPVTVAAPTATPSASATTPATGTDVAAAQTSGTSGGNVAAYVIAGLVLLALIAYLLVRSRSRARQDG